MFGNDNKDTNFGCLLSRVPKFMDPGSLDNPFIRNLLFFDISVTNSLRLMHWKNFTLVLFLQHSCCSYNTFVLFLQHSCVVSTTLLCCFYNTSVTSTSSSQLISYLVGCTAPKLIDSSRLTGLWFHWSEYSTNPWHCPTVLSISFHIVGELDGTFHNFTFRHIIHVYAWFVMVDSSSSASLEEKIT